MAFEQIQGSFHFAGASMFHSGKHTAYVALSSNRAGRVRAHFSRLLIGQSAVNHAAHSVPFMPVPSVSVSQMHGSGGLLQSAISMVEIPGASLPASTPGVSMYGSRVCTSISLCVLLVGLHSPLASQ